MKKLMLLLSLICFFSLSRAALKLPGIFTDGLVLQRNMKIPVWGWTDPNQKITVQFKKQSKSTTADSKGNWKLYLDPEIAGGPFILKVSSPNEVKIVNDVLVGEVWLCSGQSNMEFTLSSASNGPSEIAAANNPMIRQIKIPNTIAQMPLIDIRPSNGWQSESPATAGNFTAVGYFFAKELFNKMHVPVGLINSTWGGTDVETWTSRGAFENSDEFKQMIRSVPTVNLDSFAKEQQKAITKNIVFLQGNPPGSGTPSLWKNLDFNDNNWPSMTLPNLWESQSLKDVDGIVWFRKKIKLTASDILSDTELSLSMIDDNDETFINGVSIGSTKGYNIKRLYHIPAGILKEGENVIAVRVEDTGGGGGIYGTAEDLYIGNSGKKTSLSGPWLFQVEKLAAGSNVLDPNTYPTLLFNGMINPIIPFAIKGALWYQGENNSGRAYQYRKAFPLMITDWRSKWGEGNFPFYFVQLSSFNAGNGNSKQGSTWAELREAQSHTLSLPNTGMAVTTDIGNATDIHPKNKMDVGKRLAAIALNNLYGYKMVDKGPSYSSMTVNKNSIIIAFKNTGSGLEIKNNDRIISGFEIAGPDKIFYPAEASIRENKIIVSSPSVNKPIAVHYAWADDAGNANLINKDGFPAEPFRTDHWTGITESVKYHQ